jgi:hypothetical protein
MVVRTAAKIIKISLMAASCRRPRYAPMKHPETHCSCTSSATPFARWRCPFCGKRAIVRVTTLATVCDDETIRKVEPQEVAGRE